MYFATLLQAIMEEELEKPEFLLHTKTLLPNPHSYQTQTGKIYTGTRAQITEQFFNTLITHTGRTYLRLAPVFDVVDYPFKTLHRDRVIWTLKRTTDIESIILDRVIIWERKQQNLRQQNNFTRPRALSF